MRPRMYGSTDMNVLRTTISPSPGSATSTSASSKSDGCGSPEGRAASLISRLVMTPLDLHAVVVDRSAPPPMSASRSSTVALMFAPPRTCLSQWPLVEATTPGRTRSATSTFARNAPRALNTRALSPSVSPRMTASSGCSVITGSPARSHQVGLVGEDRVQEPVRGGRDQRQRMLGVPLGQRRRRVAGQRDRGRRATAVSDAELQLPRRRREAVGERHERLRVLEPHPALVPQPLEARVAEQRAAQRLVVVVQRRLARAPSPAPAAGTSRWSSRHSPGGSTAGRFSDTYMCP